MKIKNLFCLFAFLPFFFLACRTAKMHQIPAEQLTGKTAAFPKTDTFLLRLLNENRLYFDTLLKQNDQWQIQIIYTQIDRKKNNRPLFTHYYFNVDPARYFYPASTVKAPVAFLALQKLNELHLPGLNRKTTMITDTGFAGQTAVYNDPTSEDGRPTVEHYIKKIFLVSDNDAFNRLYAFLGQEYINNHLHQMGYRSAQILHRLDILLSEEQNRHTNPVTFYDTAAKIIYKQPLVKSHLLYEPRHTLMGKGYYSGDQLIHQPFDFSRKNRLSLVDLHSMMMSVIFPKAVKKKHRFRLSKDDYRFLHTYMSMYPRESRFPQYDTAYNDAYVKFLLYGAKDPVDSNIRIFNKVGDAYGFLTDAAYVADFKNSIEFFLSATIHCNPDGIYNDDKYAYDTVGFPFMKNLGQVIYQHELQRQRKNRPDLSRFQISYGQ